MLYRVLALVLVFSTFACASASAGKPNSAGCPLPVALHQLDDFVRNQQVTLTKTGMALIAELNAVAKHAKALDIPLSKQLTPSELNTFNEIRAKLAAAQSEQVVLAKYQRDAHVIAHVANVAELWDLYDVRPSSLTPRDPRQFYISVLELLRKADPTPSITPLTNVGITCDIEAGLYFQEQFNQQELLKTPDPRMQSLVADLERLRTFQRLSWALLNWSYSDLQGVSWNSTTQQAHVPNHVRPGVAKMDIVSREMYATIIPFIDENMPSRQELRLNYERRMTQAIEAGTRPK